MPVPWGKVKLSSEKPSLGLGRGEALRVLGGQCAKRDLTWTAPYLLALASLIPGLAFVALAAAREALGEAR